MSENFTTFFKRRFEPVLLSRRGGVYFRQQNSDDSKSLIDSFFASVDHALNLPLGPLDPLKGGEGMGWANEGWASYNLKNRQMYIDVYMRRLYNTFINIY